MRDVLTELIRWWDGGDTIGMATVVSAGETWVAAGTSSNPTTARSPGTW